VAVTSMVGGGGKKVIAKQTLFVWEGVSHVQIRM